MGKSVASTQLLRGVLETTGNGNRKPVHVRMLTGREDVDVLMLGRGRPFALEVVNSCLPMPPPEALAAVQQSLAAVRMACVCVCRHVEAYVLKCFGVC